MIKSTAEKKYSRIIFDAVLLVYAALLFWLFYNQLQYGITGRFESDTYVHVRFAVEDHYYHSLAAFLYIFLSWFPIGDILIAAVLSITTVTAVILCRLLILRLISIYQCKMSDIWIYIISFAANILMAFYIKKVNSAHYIGYECANMWHNSTYIFMRTFALWTILVFLDLYGGYREKIEWKKWILFTVLLAVTTGFKASFLTVFAPLLAIILLYDLIRKVKFKFIFAMACTVLPSLAVMFAQSIVLSGGSGNGYAISPFTALSLRGEHPKVSLVLSVVFPIAVLSTHIFDFYKDKIYFCTLIMWAVAFLEVFLLVETGERSLDGNFFWGYSIALFFLFLVSMIKAVRDFYENINKSRFTAYFVFTGECLIALWHILSGISYFVILLTGVTYFA